MQQTDCTKHKEPDLHFIRERVVIGDLRVLHVPTSPQYADIFTKGLPSSGFHGVQVQSEHWAGHMSLGAQGLYGR